MHFNKSVCVLVTSMCNCVCVCVIVCVCVCVCVCLINYNGHVCTFVEWVGDSYFHLSCCHVGSVSYSCWPHQSGTTHIQVYYTLLSSFLCILWGVCVCLCVMNQNNIPLARSE